jgi:hypothetical protein
VWRTTPVSSQSRPKKAEADDDRNQNGDVAKGIFHARSLRDEIVRRGVERPTEATTE